MIDNTPENLTEAVCKLLGEAPDRWVGFVVAVNLHRLIHQTMFELQGLDPDTADDEQTETSLVLATTAYIEAMEKIMELPIAQTAEEVADKLAEACEGLG